MPLSMSDFTTSLDHYLTLILNGQTGNNSMDVFSSPGVYNPLCWASHLPLSSICWENSAGFSGRGVAITRRHVICSEHGRIPDEPWHHLIWYEKPAIPGQPAIRHERRIMGAVRSIFDHGIYGGPSDSDVGFMLAYVAGDIPDACVASVMDPNELPTQIWAESQNSGRYPIVAFDQHGNHATIWEVVSISRHAERSFPNWLNNFAVNRLPPAGERLHRRQFSHGYTTGDSGAPAFLVRNNQDLIYWGQLTTASTLPDFPQNAFAEGPLCASAYGQILIACDQLSASFAGANVPWYKPGAVFGSGRRPSYRPPPSGPLGP